MSRRFAVRLIAGFSVLSCLLTSSVSHVWAASMPFPDMDRSWFAYRDSVEYLRDKDIINGYPDGTFHPKDGVNRAEFLKMIFKARSDVTPSGDRKCFPDVDSESWYAAYVCAALRRDIVAGYPDG